MILGIGVDLCQISRLEDSLAKTPNLASRLFHDNEVNLQAQSLAGRFAAKEALAKAAGNPALLSWVEIEVTKAETGKPEFVFHGATKTNLEALGMKSSFLSISHDGGVAVAMVVLEA